MKVHDLKPAPGSRRPKRRVGRGIGGKGGKTAGRGTKGQGARNTVHPGFEGGQFRRRAVLVGGADEQRLVPTRLLEPCEGVGRQHGTDQRAQMLDPIDIGKRAGDQDAVMGTCGHQRTTACVRTKEPGHYPKRVSRAN